MNYFIGDLHLFNRNQTGEGVNYDGRPFATVAEMNQYNLIVLAALLHVRIDDILITDDAVA